MKKKTKVLSFDIATTTGYATLFDNPDHTISLGSYGLIKLNCKPFDKVPSLYERALSLICSEIPDIVVIEDVYMSRNAKTFKMLSQLQAAVILAARHANKDVVIKIVPSKCVRSTLGIKSKLRADVKDEVGTTINLFYGITPAVSKIDKEDIFDAVALGVAVLADPSIANKEE